MPREECAGTSHTSPSCHVRATTEGPQGSGAVLQGHLTSVVTRAYTCFRWWQPSHAAPFQGGNTGSNPVGGARRDQVNKLSFRVLVSGRAREAWRPGGRPTRRWATSDRRMPGRPCQPALCGAPTPCGVEEVHQANVAGPGSSREGSTLSAGSPLRASPADLTSTAAALVDSRSVHTWFNATD